MKRDEVTGLTETEFKLLTKDEQNRAVLRGLIRLRLQLQDLTVPELEALLWFLKMNEEIREDDKRARRQRKKAKR